MELNNFISESHDNLGDDTFKDYILKGKKQNEWEKVKRSCNNYTLSEKKVKTTTWIFSNYLQNTLVNSI